MSVVGGGQAMSSGGLGRTLRALRDPLLLFVVPVAFALLLAFVGYGNSWPLGFDFRGTLWEPARAFLDGNVIYPEPTRDAVFVGNPTVYPPLFILLATPLALLPVGLASWVWFVLLAVAVYASMRIVGVRDWRCLVLAVTTPVIVHGLYYGNLTVLLLVPSRSPGATASGRRWRASPSVWQLPRSCSSGRSSCGCCDAALSRRRMGDRLVDRARPRRMGGDRVRRAA